TVPLSMLGTSHADTQLADTADRPGTPDESTAWNLTDISGRIELSGYTMSGDLKGRLDGVPCRLKGRLLEVQRPLEDIGLDLTTNVEGLQLPEGEARRRVAESSAVPRELRDFLWRYDPYGAMDIDVRLERPAGRRIPARILGTVSAQLRQGRFALFPYPV